MGERILIGMTLGCLALIGGADQTAAAPATWYVKRSGGAADGGTRERPARFLSKVLERARSGDVIRISGDVYGKLRQGMVSIATPNLTLEGGWNEEFSARNPVAYPTRLFRPREGGAAPALILRYTGSGSLTLDGILFDRAGHNRYAGGGTRLNWIDAAASVRIQVAGRITVRNCVFLNSPAAGLELHGTEPGEVLVTHCVFLNCVGRGVEIDCPSARVTLSNNTFALSYPLSTDSPGTGVQLKRGRLRLVRNVFAYLDAALDVASNERRISLLENRLHCLTAPAVRCRVGGKPTPLTLEDLDEFELSGKVSGNRKADPGLDLDATALLRWLQSTDASMRVAKHLEAGLREREIARALERLARPRTAKTDPAKKPGKDDPFGEDPFAGKKTGKDPKQDDPFGGDPTGQKDPGKKDPTKGSPFPAASYWAPRYPAGAAWVAAPGVSGIGAVPPTRPPASSPIDATATPGARIDALLERFRATKLAAGKSAVKQWTPAELHQGLAAFDPAERRMAVDQVQTGKYVVYTRGDGSLSVFSVILLKDAAAAAHWLGLEARSSRHQFDQRQRELARFRGLGIQMRWVQPPGPHALDGKPEGCISIQQMVVPEALRGRAALMPTTWAGLAITSDRYYLSFLVVHKSWSPYDNGPLLEAARAVRKALAGGK